MMEARLHEKTWWTTITYNNDFLPREYICLETGQCFSHAQGTLHRSHIEWFIKRVRKKLPVGKKFRYYLVGEYGEKDNRPHYHICVFGYGEEIQAVLESCWSDPVSKLPMGFVDRKKCRPLDTATARYTVGYTLKKLTKKSDMRLEGRYPEFASHSKGIGLEFAKRFADALRTQSGSNYILTHLDIPRTVRFDGKWWPLDLYLRSKILEHLGITDVLLAEGQSRFQKEMRSLSLRAELNPKFFFNRGAPISPYMMKLHYQDENAQAILNTETRAKLKMKEKPL